MIAQITALSAAGAAPADAEARPDERRLTLAEAVVMAFEHNAAFRVERLQPKISATFIREERADFDPTLAAELSIGKTDSDTSTVKPEAITTNLDGRSDIRTGKAGLTQKLPSGTRLDLTAEKSAVRADYSPEPGNNYDDQNDATHYSAVISQPLLRGFGTTVNLARLRQARLDHDISRYELFGAALDLAAGVETAGWNCVLADRQLKIYAESLSLAERQLDEVRERIEVGYLADIELAAAEAEVAQRRESLINARGAIARSRLELLRLVGTTGQSGEWDNPPSISDEPFVPAGAPETTTEHVTSALADRPELNEARLRIKRGDLEVARTRNGLLPRLDFFIKLGRTVYSDSFGSSQRDVDRTEDILTGGLIMEYPLGARSDRAARDRALLQREQADAALDNLSDLIQMEVRIAALEFQRTGAQIEATRATRLHRAEALRAENEKFRVGKSTTLLVAQAQRDLLASRIAEVEALINHLKALLELHRMDGSLLRRRGIEFGQQKRHVIGD